MEIGHEEVHDPFNRSRALHFSRVRSVNFLSRLATEYSRRGEEKKARLIATRLSRDCSKRLSYQYSTSGVVLRVSYAYEATSESVRGGGNRGTEETKRKIYLLHSQMPIGELQLSPFKDSRGIRDCFNYKP